MKQATVFISYRSVNYSSALWIKNVLESRGISCWMASESLSGGSNYATEIPIAIKNCTFFLVIISKATMESIWVPRELDQAINQNKYILPFMIEETQLNEAFGFYLTNVQIYKAYENRDAALNKLISEIYEKSRIKNGGYINIAEETGKLDPQTFSFLQKEIRNSKILSYFSIALSLIIPYISIVISLIGLSKIKKVVPIAQKTNDPDFITNSLLAVKLHRAAIIIGSILAVVTTIVIATFE